MTIAPGAYTLSVKRGGIRITAADEDGIGYALQTLRQLILPTGIPTVEIKDKPRLEYRGLMLDESRHFFGVEEVKKLLDEMQRYKLNRLHWHLTGHREQGRVVGGLAPTEMTAR